MATRFMCSGQHMATADLTQKWTTVTNTVINAGSGPRGGNSIRTTTNGRTISITLDSQATWTVHVRVKATTLAAAILIALMDNASLQCELRLNADGTLSVTNNGTVRATSVDSVNADEYFHVQFKSTINTSGAWQVKVNSTDWIAAGSGDTQTSANASANVIRFFANSVNQIIDIADIYINDGTGSDHNSFDGDIRVDAHFATADGDVMQFTPSSGSDGYAMVDETTPDGDTTYIETSTIGHKSLFQVQNLDSSPAAIYAVQLLASMRKTDATGINARLLTKSGGNEYESSDIAAGDTYVYARQVRETDPATAAAWTEAGVNAIQAGLKYES